MNNLSYKKALRPHFVLSRVYVIESKDTEFQHKGLLFTAVMDVRIGAASCLGRAEMVEAPKAVRTGG